MELRKIKLSKLKPYPNNPRINDDAVQYVAESIRQCGYVAPIIVDEDMVILAGHTRYKALKKLKYDDAEVIVKEGLSEEQKKKYRLLDNKTNEYAQWNEELLKLELKDIDFDGFDFGFDFEEESIDFNDLDDADYLDEDPPINVKITFKDTKTFRKWEEQLRQLVDSFEDATISVGGDYETDKSEL